MLLKNNNLSLIYILEAFIFIFYILLVHPPLFLESVLSRDGAFRPLSQKTLFPPGKNQGLLLVREGPLGL